MSRPKIHLNIIKGTSNSYFCVTPKNHWLMFAHENIKKHLPQKKQLCVFTT